MLALTDARQRFTTSDALDNIRARLITKLEFRFYGGGRVQPGGTPARQAICGEMGDSDHPDEKRAAEHQEEDKALVIH